MVITTDALASKPHPRRSRHTQISIFLSICKTLNKSLYYLLPVPFPAVCPVSPSLLSFILFYIIFILFLNNFMPPPPSLSLMTRIYLAVNLSSSESQGEKVRDKTRMISYTTLNYTHFGHSFLFAIN
jgi:hypothetical protein